MSDEIDASTPTGRRSLVVIGIVFIAIMAFPFFCSESGGCHLYVVTPWKSIGWIGRAAILAFVCAGLSMILSGLRQPFLAGIAGLGVLFAFDAILNSLFFGLRVPACGVGIGLIRAAAEARVFPLCELWPTVGALWIDAFFLGFVLEVFRKQFLPPALKNPLKPWTEGLLLASLSPLLLLMLVMLIPTIGQGAIKASWQKWRGK